MGIGNNGGLDSANFLPTPDSGKKDRAGESGEHMTLIQNTESVISGHEVPTDELIMAQASNYLLTTIYEPGNPVFARFYEKLKAMKVRERFDLWDRMIALVYSDLIGFRNRARTINKAGGLYIDASINYLSEPFLEFLLTKHLTIHFLRKGVAKFVDGVTENSMRFVLGDGKESLKKLDVNDRAAILDAVRGYLTDGLAYTDNEDNVAKGLGVMEESAVNRVLGVKSYESRIGHFFYAFSEAFEKTKDITVMRVELNNEEVIDEIATRRKLMKEVAEFIECYSEKAGVKVVIVFADEKESIAFDVVVTGLDKTTSQVKAIDLCRNLEASINDIRLKPRIFLNHISAGDYVELSGKLNGNSEINFDVKKEYFDDHILPKFDAVFGPVGNKDGNGVYSENGHIYELGSIIDENLSYWLSSLMMDAHNHPGMVARLIGYLKLIGLQGLPRPTDDLFTEDLRIVHSPQVIKSFASRESILQEGEALNIKLKEKAEREKAEREKAKKAEEITEGDLEGFFASMITEKIHGEVTRMLTIGQTATLRAGEEITVVLRMNPEEPGKAEVTKVVPYNQIFHQRRDPQADPEFTRVIPSNVARKLRGKLNIGNSEEPSEDDIFFDPIAADAQDWMNLVAKGNKPKPE